MTKLIGIQFFVVGASAILLSACGGTSGMGTVSTDTSPTNCQCCTNPTSCDITGAGDTGSANTGAHYTLSALNNLSSAKQLTDPNPNQFAAKAVDGAPKSSTSQTTPGASSGSGHLAGGLSTSARSAGGSSGSASGGMGTSLGDTSTQAAEIAATDTTMAPNNESGAAYAGNAQGGGGSRGSGGLSNPFASLFGGDGADSGVGKNGTAGSVNFGGTRNPASGLAASGTADPNDYFSRIGEHDNLFKVVERRYQKEAMNWEATAVGLSTPVKK